MIVFARLDNMIFSRCMLCHLLVKEQMKAHCIGYLAWIIAQSTYYGTNIAITK